MAEITRAYQDGKCSICKKDKPVRVIVDGSRCACVCESCVNDVRDMPVTEVIEKYGKKFRRTKQSR